MHYEQSSNKYSIAASTKLATQKQDVDYLLMKNTIRMSVDPGWLGLGILHVCGQRGDWSVTSLDIQHSTSKVNTRIFGLIRQDVCNIDESVQSRDVCVMVSPNRQGHIVATLPKESGYGRYRNMTPHHHPTSAPILCNKSTPRDGLSCRGYSESEPGNDAGSSEQLRREPCSINQKVTTPCKLDASCG